jgi:beta-1,3-glucuronyltransferase
MIATTYLNNPHLSRDAILYFADSDNTYDLRLVTELVRTRQLSVFPVGFTGKSLYERCFVDESTGLVAGFVGWRGGRKFPVDMAGFAFTLKVSKRNGHYKQF